MFSGFVKEQRTIYPLRGVSLRNVISEYYDVRRNGIHIVIIALNEVVF